MTKTSSPRMGMEDILDDFREDDVTASLIPRYVGLLRFLISALLFILVLFSSLKSVLESLKNSIAEGLGAAIGGVVILAYFFSQVRKGFREINNNFRPTKYRYLIIAIIINIAFILIFFSGLITAFYTEAIRVINIIINLLFILSFAAFLFYDLKHIRFVSKK